MKHSWDLFVNIHQITHNLNHFGWHFIEAFFYLETTFPLILALVDLIRSLGFYFEFAYMHAYLVWKKKIKINLEKESKAYILPIVWIFSIMVKLKYLVKSCMKFFVKSTLIWTVRSNSMNTCRFVKSQHLFSSYLFKHKHTQTDTRFQILRHSIYPIDFDCFASMINAVFIRNLYFFR